MPGRLPNDMRGPSVTANDIVKAISDEYIQRTSSPQRRMDGLETTATAHAYQVPLQRESQGQADLTEQRQKMQRQLEIEREERLGLTRQLPVPNVDHVDQQEKRAASLSHEKELQQLRQELQLVQQQAAEAQSEAVQANTFAKALQFELNACEQKERESRRSEADRNHVRDREASIEVQRAVDPLQKEKQQLLRQLRAKDQELVKQAEQLKVGQSCGA